MDMSIIIVLFGGLHSTNAQFTCEEGWSLYKDHCYNVSPSGGVFLKIFSEASKKCNQSSATLVSINDEDENEEMKSLIEAKLGTNITHQQFWIGLSNDNPAKNTAKREDKRKGWYWMDGSHLTWTNWANANKGEPTGGSKYVRMVWKNHLVWADAGRKDRTKYRYICEKAALLDSTAAPVESTSTPSRSSHVDTTEIQETKSNLIEIGLTTTAFSQEPLPERTSRIFLYTASSVGGGLLLLTLLVVGITLHRRCCKRGQSENESCHLENRTNHEMESTGMYINGGPHVTGRVEEQIYEEAEAVLGEPNHSDIYANATTVVPTRAESYTSLVDNDMYDSRNY